MAPSVAMLFQTPASKRRDFYSPLNALSAQLALK
jgi:hypothetical protein